MLVRRVLAALLVAPLAACSDPYADGPKLGEPVPTASGPARTVGDDLPQPAPTPERAGRVAVDDVRSVARSYATRETNWDARTYPRRLRELGDLATGDLAVQLRTAATDAAMDESLRRDRPSSTGSVETVVVRGDRRSARLLVVTRETRSAGGTVGLEGARYRVTLARAVRTSRGWRISRWEPQP